MFNNTNSPYVNAPQSSLYNSGMTDYRKYGNVPELLKQRAANPYAGLAAGSYQQPVAASTIPFKSLSDKQSFLNKDNGGGMFDNILGDENKMGNISSLASTLMQAASLPSMLTSANLQNKTAQHNLDVGRVEHKRRNNNITGFNRQVTV